MILNMKTTYIFVYTYLLVQLNRKGHAHSSAKLNNSYAKQCSPWWYIGHFSRSVVFAVGTYFKQMDKCNLLWENTEKNGSKCYLEWKQRHRLTSPEIQNYQRQFYFGKIHADFLFIYLSFYHFQWISYNIIFSFHFSVEVTGWW